MKPNNVLIGDFPLIPTRPALRWLLFSWLGVSFYTFARYSSSHPLPVLCPFRRLTGLRCPLCGFTTSTARLLQGDLRGAVRAHPLGPAVLLGATLWYGWTTGETVHNWLVFRRKGAAPLWQHAV